VIISGTPALQTLARGSITLRKQSVDSGMTLLTEGSVRAAARATRDRIQKSASTSLSEAADTTQDSFDIFLSHAIIDADIVLGTRTILQRFGYSVYVDWLVDIELDRSTVTPETAAHLKWRMHQCDTLFYLSTENAPTSKWMPWELGYFDAHSDGRVAILPVVKNPGEERFRGQEYLGLYPYVYAATLKNTSCEMLWVNRRRREYGRFDLWKKNGAQAIKKRAS
jgi:hypothetical protein